jgi:hypothetical protein
MSEQNNTTLYARLKTRGDKSTVIIASDPKWADPQALSPEACEAVAAAVKKADNVYRRAGRKLYMGKKLSEGYLGVSTSNPNFEAIATAAGVFEPVA